MPELGYSQPFSFWILGVILVLSIILTFLAFLTWNQAGVRQRWLSGLGVAFTVAAFIAMIAPVYVGQAMCGPGAGAPAWLYRSDFAPSQCRWAQWEYFWLGFTLLTLGLGASVGALFSHIRRPGT